MSSIRTSCLLYRPSLSIWTARKLDKTASVHVNAEAGAVAGAANVHKQLLPDSKELDAVQKWANSFRTFMYTSTSPWDDAGWRIRSVVPTAKGQSAHMEFMAQIGDRITIGYLLVQRLLAVYHDLCVESQKRLGHLHRYEDYPTRAEVEAKYRFSVDCMPMPSADDFRVVDGVPKAEVDKLIATAERSMNEKLNAAMKEAYQRLYDVIAKMANTLEQYGNKTVKKFNDSLVDNIAELVAVMPALNLTGDPQLAALAADAQQLALYSAVDLRQDDAVRKAAIKDARSLALKFKGVVADAELPPPVHAPTLVPGKYVPAPRIEVDPLPSKPRLHVVHAPEGEPADDTLVDAFSSPAEVQLEVPAPVLQITAETSASMFAGFLDD